MKSVKVNYRHACRGYIYIYICYLYHHNKEIKLSMVDNQPHFVSLTAIFLYLIAPYILFHTAVVEIIVISSFMETALPTICSKTLR